MKKLLKKTLPAKEIKAKLKTLNNWTINAKGTEISKVFPEGSFIKGLTLVAKITVHAEILNHHPDIELTYGKVKVKLTTHDVKGLTKLDFDLAKRIDALGVSSF